MDFVPVFAVLLRIFLIKGFGEYSEVSPHSSKAQGRVSLSGLPDFCSRTVKQLVPQAELLPGTGSEAESDPGNWSSELSVDRECHCMLGQYGDR